LERGSSRARAQIFLAALIVRSLIIQPRAQLDIDDALTWYQPRDPDLVPRFLAELDSVFDRITQNPGQFPVEADPIRRALLRKFPFAVFFIDGGDLAAIVAVLRHTRRPVNWKRRTSAG
jgi:plasmid stabilization system protein ParE